MKKILLLALFAISAFSFTAFSQTNTTCNASFTWNMSGTTVKFIPVSQTDTLYVQNIWYIGDYGFSYSVSPYYTFPVTGGTFSVKHVFIRTNPNGLEICRDSVTNTITIPADCVIPDFAFSSDSTNYLKINFTNTSLNYTSKDSISWMFGDGSTSADINATHTYANTGIYHVCLLIKKVVTTPGTAVCIKEKCYDVVVDRPCNLKVDFNFQKDPVYYNKVYFANATTPYSTADSVMWSFGDAGYSSVNSPTHTYNGPGTYTVCLTIKRPVTFTGATPCYNYICKTIQIVDTSCNIVPTYSWLKDSTNSLKINFTNTTTAGLNSTDSIKWSFGDGSALVKAFNTSHVYTQAGKYNVCMVIYHGANCVKYKCDSVTVTTPVCVFKPSFTWKLDSANNMTFHFTNTTNLPVASATTVYWYFGDGTSVPGWDATHTYTLPGGYRVSLSIQTNPYCYQTYSDSITVTAPGTTCDIAPTYTWAKDSTNSLKINFTNTTTALNSTDSMKWSFGDGSATVKAFNTSHVYANAGKYSVCMILYHGANCVKYKCDSITVTVPVCDFIPNFTWVKDSVNSLKINFTNTTPGFTAKINWFFGDTSTAATTTWNASHTYTAPGKYYVCLRVQDYYNTSCYKYKCDSITVTAPVTTCDIVPTYTWVKDSTNSLKINFTNTTTALNSTDSIKWNFGDGSATVKAFNTSHVYANAGKYSVCMILYHGANCVKYKCDSITVTAPVTTCNNTPYFISTTDSLQYNTIHFTNYSSPAIAVGDSVSWTFGDGTTSQSHDINLVHTYSQPGTYNVCLFIKKQATGATASCSKEICKTVTVAAPVTCNFVPLFTWIKDSVNSYKINFTNTSTGLVAADSIRWVFGDGSAVATSFNASHVYANAGKYYVCLRVSYGTSCVIYKCDSVTVTAPVCDFTLSKKWSADSTNSQMIKFVGSSTLHDTTGASVIWAFGDGTTATGWNATHTYTSVGKYYVCLRVAINNQTCVKYSCDSVTVSANCSFTPSYTMKSDSVNQQKINFTNTSNVTSASATVIWSFGDGTTATGWTATHEYAQPGKYALCVKVQVSNTCYKYKCDSIIVLSNCNFTPSYTWKVDSTNSLKINFTNTTVLSSTANTVVNWTFGDGSSATAWSPAHAYSAPSKYYVCLRIQSGSTSCVKYKCDSITVSYPPVNIECTQYSLFKILPSTSNNLRLYFFPLYTSKDVEYTWTFGDGTGSKDSISSHLFAHTGIYNVCLTAFKNTNCASTSCTSIRVDANVNCDTVKLAYNLTRDQYMQNKIYLSASSNAPIMQQSWSITKLSLTGSTPVILNQNNPVYDFSDTGYYQICLTAYYAGGCSKKYCSTIRIEGMPTVCELQTYPNPAQIQVWTYVPLTQATTIKTYLYNAQNVLLLEKVQTGAVGSNTVLLDIQNMVSGFYILKIVYGNNICYAKFQKL